jgi:ribonuclease HI
MTATHQFTDNKNNKELTSIYSALEDLAQAKEWIVDVYDSSDYIYKDIKISLIYDQKKLPLVFEF